MTQHDGKHSGSLVYTLLSDGSEPFYTEPYGRLYGVVLAAELGESSAVVVEGGCEQDAIDEAIDYAESQGWEGYFLDTSDIEELESDGFLEEHVQGGNHGRYLASEPTVFIVRNRRHAKQAAMTRLG